MPKSRNMFKKLFNSRKSKKDIEEIVAQRGPKQFTFETLYSATEGFHEKNKLGRGGFANVYKGVLKNGRKIAVKKPLVISEKGKKDFMNEAKLLLECANHRNVVKFLGFCSHGEEILLVFDFSINGNLDNLLFKTGRADELDWKRTYDIILGIARGLRYLHEEAHSVIIHFDIKPANILIDENWVPKIADFGTASLFPQDQTDVNISQVAGTPGYLAPECYVYGPLSVKADTYSFGVVVLELISNQKNWLSTLALPMVKFCGIK
ncbi:putative receptor-like protein kinase At4g00960 [Camellia sinensis]|uniref:putative receptor-like protein kinase At4g00960 n=1 Tax=Camellia sinensis TaxID=4442 RepID=UPI001035848A|nr:putative receptor-like protein kinase At4g00960 [Camellia sinensis]